MAKPPIVYLMRGLPSCGKSYTARRLAADRGVVLETDQFFYTEVGNDPTRYDYSAALLAKARRWNFGRFQAAVGQRVSPIVVDRGNGLNQATRQYARHAVEHGYAVELKEPESPWWHELSVLLKYKKYVADELLDAWAQRLASKNRRTHRVPASTIRHWMHCWRCGLTVADILTYEGGAREPLTAQRDR